MAADTITGTITTGVTLTSAVYTNPVTIASGASITATSGPSAVDSNESAWTVQNDGTISGGSHYDGVRFDGVGGALTNDQAGSILGNAYGVFITGPDGAVKNAGSIGGGVGVYIGLGTDASVANAGTITGGARFGVWLAGTNATLENSGTIAGGESAYLAASSINRLVVDPGAVFVGDVVAKASAANTLELASGASAGTISGFGERYQGFQAIAIDSGATWDVAGSLSAFQGVTINGFDNDDKLDLTGLAFNAADTAELNRSTDIVTIKDSGGHAIGTIQLAGDFTGEFFHLLDDGNSGTFVEDDETPCFCRGTHIRTPRGEAAIETLAIGDLVMTADGPLPLRWIGRRSYHDWLAVGNPDVQPILFRAGSLADRIPARDLMVSPQHAMFLDGMLVPARHLVNGISIVKREGMERIDYFHLELDRHAVIFAEGAAAESFADDDSRDAFHNAPEFRALYPDAPRRRFVEYCAPRIEDGYALEALRRALTSRATRLQPNRKATRTPAQQGYLDRATRTTVEGWALPPSGNEPVMLEIVVNGAVVGQTLADRHREDLKSAGFGGHCSFHFVLPQPLSPDLSHQIEIRRQSDWTLLHGGPVTLRPAITRAAA